MNEYEKNVGPIDYNEDDCRATRVLRDALDSLVVMPEGAG